MLSLWCSVISSYTKLLKKWNKNSLKNLNFKISVALHAVLVTILSWSLPVKKPLAQACTFCLIIRMKSFFYFQVDSEGNRIRYWSNFALACNYITQSKYINPLNVNQMETESSNACYRSSFVTFYNKKWVFYTLCVSHWLTSCCEEVVWRLRAAFVAIAIVGCKEVKI